MTFPLIAVLVEHTLELEEPGQAFVHFVSLRTSGSRSVGGVYRTLDIEPALRTLVADFRGLWVAH